MYLQITKKLLMKSRMAKIIRLTESDLYEIVKDAVSGIMKNVSNLHEEFVGGANSDAGLNGDGSGDPSMGVSYPAFGVQRRKIYSPKDPTLKRHNGKGGSISIPKERE